MRLSLSIIFLLICICYTVTASGQTTENVFFVKHTFIDTDANARFVRMFVNNIISWNKKSSDAEIACLKNEVAKTMLFSIFESRLERVEDSNEYNLLLKVGYKDSNPVYIVNKIEITGFDGLDKDKFYSLMEENQLIKKRINLKTDFPEFENLIVESVKKSLKQQDSMEYFEIPWIDIRLNSSRKLEVIVKPKFEGCVEIQNKSLKP